VVYRAVYRMVGKRPSERREHMETEKRSMEATVSEIHAYPLRPEGFAEPLFWGPENKREVMEHFLEASWVQRASEAAGAARGDTRGNVSGSASGHAAHAVEESVVLERRGDGALVLERGRRCGRRSRNAGRKSAVRWRAVRRVLGRWREVWGWWEPSGGRDFVLYRLLLSDGAVVEVARDLAEGLWKLVGVVD
jgi:hypothetical protein